MALPPIIGRLVADTSDFARGMGSVVGIVGGAVAAIGGAKLLGGAIEEMEEAQKVGNQTAASIKSTGGAANISVKQVEDLAGELSNLAAIDDEVIQSSANVLMTFTQVRNEVGKGNDIFNQATKAALNMSVAMGSDLQTATVQVGKALNDPIKGVGALRRVGVQLTEQQEKSIETMVEQGDVMGAQKVILSELETQFGGSAAAQATATAKMRVAWGNLQESAGKALAPLVEMVAGAAPKVFSWLETTAGVLSTRFTPAWNDAKGGLMAFVSAFKAGDGEVTSGGFAGTMERFGSLARQVWERVQEAWPRIREVISEAMTTVQAVISGVVAIVMTIWANFGSQIVGILKAAWDFVVSIVDAAMNIVRGVIDVVTGLIQGDWGRVWDGIKSILSGAWDAIKAIISGALGIIKNLLSVAWEIITGVVSGAWEGIEKAVSSAIENVIGFMRGLPGRALEALGNIGSLLLDAGKKLIQGFIDGILGMFGSVKETLGNLAGKLTSWKGPPSKDARLLYSAGQLVIGGFIRGMESQYGDVRASLGGLGGTIGGYGPGLVGSSGSGGGITIIVHGSVITERQLIDTVRDGLVDLSRHLPSGSLFGAAA